MKGKGSGAFLIMHGGGLLHTDGVFFDLNVGGGYQFELGKIGHSQAFLRVGYQQQFVGGVRHNYQVLNTPGDGIDSDRIGTIFVRYGF